MIHEPYDNSTESLDASQQRVDDIVNRGPGGAIALAGTAAIIVLLIWFAFYFFVFLPRT